MSNRRVGLEAQADQEGRMLAAIFSRGFPYWMVTKAFRRQFMGLMGANNEVVARLTPGQLQSIGRVIEYMKPVAPRAAGAMFDNQARLPGTRLAGITAPTLIVRAVDDTLQLYRNAEFAAAAVPSAPGPMRETRSSPPTAGRCTRESRTNLCL